jgi:hypothetical protein
MTKSEIKKQLNSYTKKQLVEALSDILSLNYDYIFYEIVGKINRNIFDNEKIRLNMAQKEWETASANKINYLKNLKVVNVSELKPSQYKKFIQLVSAEQKAWTKLEKLQDEQLDRLCQTDNIMREKN